MIIFFLNETAYVSMVQLATVLYLVPYLFSALYLVLLAARGRGFAHPHAGRLFDDSGPAVTRGDNRRHLAVGVVALLYAGWLFYAADLTYLLFGALAVIPGLIPYVWTRLQANERVFNAFEWAVVALLLAAAGGAVWGLAQGTLSL